MARATVIQRVQLMFKATAAFWGVTWDAPRS
jgi:hypothetical protein